MNARSLATITLAITLFPGTAHASSVTTERLHTLAAAAEHDAHALEQLQDVTEVDGRPVDMRALLSGTPAERRNRLHALASSQSTSAAAGAPGRAQEIVDERRFHAAPIPRPFAGLLRRIAEPLRRLFDSIAAHIPWGPTGLWIAIALVVLGAAALIARRAVGRRAAALEYSPRPSDRRRRETAQDLEQRALDAERSGDLDTAFRLLFRAGLLRLDEATLIAYRDSLTTREIARTLRSGTFDALAARFEEVAYGDIHASSDDVSIAKERWPRVVSEAAA